MRMTKQRTEVMEKLKSGIKLIIVNGERGGKHYYFSDGAEIGLDQVAWLIGQNCLAPTGDGLFGDSQSFKLSEAALCGA